MLAASQTIVSLGRFSLTSKALHAICEMATPQEPYVRLWLPFYPYVRRLENCLFAYQTRWRTADDKEIELDGATLILGPRTYEGIEHKVISIEGPTGTIGIDWTLTGEHRYRRGMAV